MNLERVCPAEQSSISQWKLQQLPVWFSWASHLGAHRKRWGRVGELLDSFMPSCFLVLRTSGFTECRVCEGRGLQEAELLRHKDSPALGIVGSAAAWQENPRPL